jgi:hypothetical protein
MPPCWISAAVCSQAVHVPATGAGGGPWDLLSAIGYALIAVGLLWLALAAWLSPGRDR